MSREEFATIPHDRILVSGEVYEGIKRTHLVRYVGLLRPKDIRRRYEVFMVHWCSYAKIDLPDFIVSQREPPSKDVRIAVRLLKPNVSPATRFELRGMDWYEEADAPYFIGRAEDVRAVRGLVADYPVFRLVGPSGVGKSSLLRAGLLPALRQLSWRAAVVRPFGDPARSLPAELSRELLTENSEPLTTPLRFANLRGDLAPLLEAENCSCLVLLIDQVENILSPFADPGAQTILVDFLREIFRTSHLRPMLKVVLAYGTDADARLGPLWQEVSGQAYGLPYHSMNSLSSDAAETIIRETARRKGWMKEFSPKTLVTDLVNESHDVYSSGQVYPPYLQLLLAELEASGDRGITQEFLAKRGGVGGIVGKYLERTLSELEQRGGDWVHCRKILEALSRSSGEKSSQTENDIMTYARLAPESLHSLLSELVRRRLVRPLGGGQYEIQHERLAAAVRERMKDADRELKEVADLLAVKAINYPRTHELLSRSELQLFYKHRRRLRVGHSEGKLVLSSMLTLDQYQNVRELGWFWFAEHSFETILALLRVLAKDENSSVRRVAVEAIGCHQQSEDMALLHKLTQDRDPEVRQAAVKAIAQSRQPGALPLLRELAGSRRPDILPRAVQAIAQYQQQQDLPMLRQLAQDAEPDFRLAAVEAIAQYGEAEDLPLLRELSRDERPATRRAAVKAIGRYQQAHALPLLRELARDEDVYVRWAAVEAIGRLEQAEDLPLFRELAEDPDGDVRLAAVEAIVLYQRVEDLALFRELARDPHGNVREAAVKAIAQHLRAEDLLLLRELALDPDPDVRHVAVEAIARYQRAEDLPLLRKLARPLPEEVRPPDEVVRRAAIEAIALYQRPEDLPLLRDLACDPDDDVHRAAVKAIAQYKQARDSGMFRQQARDKNPGMRLAAVEVVAQCQQPDALPLLREMTRDDDPRVRGAALGAIARYKQLEDLPVLHQLARDAIPSIRLVSVQAISQYQQPGNLSFLQQMACDENRAVQQAAAEALVRASPREELEMWLDQEGGTLSFEVLSALDCHLYRPTWWKEAQGEK
jgi:HEAT repeat protein